MQISQISSKYLNQQNLLKLGKSKRQARHTTDGEFSPDVNGVFQFMVVFDYTSPLSTISNIKVNAINNSK